MMERILIADDEFLIRKGLRAILERSGIAFTEIVECENGRQALTQISERRFDLAIMDIRMPEMDGLTAIKEALELESPPCFMILSGYDDFTFARQAIRFGVHDYLLKPVDMNELIASVRKVESYIENKRRNQSWNDTHARLTDTMFDNELNYILLNMNLKNDEINEIIDNLGAGYMKEAYLLMSFELAPDDLTSAGEQEALKDVVAEAAAELNAYAVCIDYNNNILIIVPGDTNIQKIKSSFEQKFSNGYVLGVSERGEGAGDIRTCYLQAVESKRYRILMGRGHVMKYGDFVSHSKPFNLPVEQIRKIQALVGTSQISQITEVLNDIFSRVKAAEYGVDYLEKCANAFSTYITDYYARLLPDSLETENNRDIRSVYNFDSIDDYLLALRNYLSSLDGYVQMLKTQYKESNKMEEVLSWLEANFANPNLSMSMAANQISLNYTYFSMVFREHTGMSFVNYLKKLRIQKARELIERRVYKVSQVATMTGFHNPRLFSRTFREETGITPAEYICKAALLGRFAGHS